MSFLKLQYPRVIAVALQISSSLGGDFAKICLVCIQILTMMLKGATQFLQILRIIRVWSLFCSIRVNICVHFLPILLEN